MSDDLPDPSATIAALDDLLHALLGDDVDLNDPAAVETASDRFERRMEEASQAERNEIGAVLVPAAESAEQISEGYQRVVTTAEDDA